MPTTQTMRRLPLAIVMALALAACAGPSPAATPAPTAAPAPAPTATPAPATPLVVAHRGGAALAPENTLGAFRNAVKLGVDMVECDVHLSKDGELVVMHDADLSRTTDGKGLISSMALAELTGLNAAARFSGGWPTAEPIPTLGEVLDAVKGKAMVQIEIKVNSFPGRYQGIEQKVIDAVKARGMADQVIVISFDLPTLADVKKIDLSIKTGALANANWMTWRLNKTREEIVEEVVQACGADYFMPTASSVSEELVKAVHARGLKIGVWTVNTAAEMERFAAWGVDAITTDKPDELKRVLGK